MAKYISWVKNVTPSDLSHCNEAVSFLQSGFWGSFKARFGWSARGFSIDWGDFGKTQLMAIRRRIAPGVSFVYAPWGPELPANFPQNDKERSQALVDIATAIQPLLPEGTAFMRFDPPWFSEASAPPLYAPMSRAGADIQPPDTVLVDLSGNEDAILSAMKSKWRYNIRLATKKKVTVKRVDEAGLPQFYALLKITSKRDGIAAHSFEYYETLFSHCREYPAQGQELALYLAEHEGDILAGAVVLFRGKDAVYLYGASANNKRNLMAAYLLQWRAMSEAKSKGCAVYDLFGIPPDENPKHSMSGLYRFKTGFGGKIIHRPGSWDYAYRPFTRKLFNAAESARKTARSLKKFFFSFF
jgi:lipid II:glycine glycyltransferase (peptidoglycan interpeptide bridge formation enzyme)